MVKLFVCSKCKKIYYCSKECQKKEWPLHKYVLHVTGNSVHVIDDFLLGHRDSCRDFVTVNQRIEKLSLMDTSAAQREKDWVAWRDSVDHWPYISALRLHEDPGRARTHLVVEQSVYTPNAGKLAKNKFQIVKCAVFRMLDAYTEIERIMGLDRGEGVEYCDGLLQEPERTQTGLTFIPFLTLRYHEGFASAWLNCDEIDTRKLESGTYNRNWRKNINGNRPPTQLVLRDDIEDAEFD
ncbi:hypothetical protein EVJ58_g9675 [Rhodofomes roseus]|uniref:MYND-type domain-containing protein n=1 Tax=Rhodofomes roseus TaxID=34475 RepID=A0A4Y9XTC9_9APHY|nr:hypothetical protein EVJ58_g9675 [Rhodofomes roseus]